MVHLVGSCEYNDHFERVDGLTTFGSEESELVPEACLEVLVLFPSSYFVTLAIHGTPNKHEHGWELIRAGSYVWEHAVMECMELLLACHVP